MNINESIKNSQSNILTHISPKDMWVLLSLLRDFTYFRCLNYGDIVQNISSATSNNSQNFIFQYISGNFCSRNRSAQKM